MRSRAARLTASAAAWIALGTAAYFLFTTENRISNQRRTLQAFDLRAHETISAVSDMRVAQQAYVAAGQGVGFWMPKVAALQPEVASQVDDLRATAASADARRSLMEAAATIREFDSVDRRARDFLKSGQTLMAGDVIFAEGGETAVTVARQVESARLAEHQAFNGEETRLRQRQAGAIGGAMALSAFFLWLLAFALPARSRQDAGSGIAGEASDAAGTHTDELMLRPLSRASPATPGETGPATLPGGLGRGSVPVLKAAAELCTEFNRVTDPADLQKLLARVAEVMDASGLVVWLGDLAGADLRPVLSHGYPDHVLARMSNVPRSASNAAAAAYRTGKLQIVLRRPGASNGAVVAPLLAAEGCVGALTAEILEGSETADSVQALATLFAAQLTGMLAGSAVAASAESQRVVG